MGLFSFIKEAGEKLFGGKDAEAATLNNPAATEELNAKAAKAIETYIASQNLGASNVQVAFDGAQGKVTVKGTAPTQSAKEKITLCCGNVANVTSVDNQMDVTNPEPEAQYHDVVRGDTLSAIAKKFYGDANKYPQIFEANKPMLTTPTRFTPVRNCAFRPFKGPGALQPLKKKAGPSNRRGPLFHGAAPFTLGARAAPACASRPFCRAAHGCRGRPQSLRGCCRR
jgi:LysM repeat protein